MALDRLNVLEAHLRKIAKRSDVLLVVKLSDLREIVNGLCDDWKAKQDELSRNDAVITKEEANALPTMGKSEATLMRWDKNGYLPKVRIGRRVGYRLSDLKKIGAL